MEILFNELSVEPINNDKFEANEKMKRFVEAVSLIRKKGIKNIRSHLPSNQINLSPDYTLYDWMFNKNEVSEVDRNLLVGMIINPFIKDEDTEIVDRYIMYDYYFEDANSGIEKTKCLGLSGAYLYDTLSISIASLPVWEKNKLSISIENTEDIEINIQNVLNISTKESFNNEDISSFLETVQELDLIRTSISSDDKNIHLADHHGKAELKTLCDRMKHNDYVIEMRSMEWCRGRCDKFIKKINKDGYIEIVLFKEVRKYGLLVKTTGRNYRETKAISEILEDKYS